MPWRMVHAEFGSARPYIHWQDPGNPIHMVTGLKDGRVDVLTGSNVLAKCAVRLTLDTDGARILRALRFRTIDINVLHSIMTSLGCTAEERAEALGEFDALIRRTPPNGAGFWCPRLRTDEDNDLVIVSNWPKDLDETELRAAVDAPGLSKMRRGILVEEMRRRGMAFNEPAVGRVIHPE